MQLQFLTGGIGRRSGKALERHGVSRQRRFNQPGHWAHGDRKRRSRRVGKSKVIGVIDDHVHAALEREI
ncbi:hypothetical protein [Paraconexibacter sp.]|uniref:hypothetical protein n=1 Tax=Paraconexibacter sp. TaxID=2949640 RepID=UPI00356A88E5